MRVGIVTYDFDPPIGGLGVVARQYRDALRSMQVDTVVFSPAPQADNPVSRFASWMYRHPGGCPFFSLACALSLPRLLRKHRIDVLLVHTGSGGVFLLRSAPCPTAVLAHHTYADEIATVFVGRPLIALWKRCMALLERRTYRLATRIFAVSRDTAESIAASYRLSSRSITVIENPVDPVFFAPRTKDEDASPTILYVGRLEPRKGTDVLIRAFALLRARMPVVRLTLIGADLMGASLQRLLDDLHLRPFVRLLGHIPQQERIARMQSATVIAVPSLLEGFGLIAAEAMAMGKPIVASSSLGLRSILRHEETGLLVAPRDVRELADMLHRALSDPALRSRLGVAASIDAAQRFSLTLQSTALLRELSNLHVSSLHS